jgi:hypothetical protein
MLRCSNAQVESGGTEGNAFSRVLDPIRTTIMLSAAVQEGFLGWGNGFNRVFRVATGKTVVFEVCGDSR